ncbi:unnamed protein product [Oncorhynchus mykiss]|uniref:Cadherin domain-containing protein n=1 Tax=Oncorhynchus mykiss TaxID=8022 RepID=A0A060XAE3_ONCMY|nr:unnamed protein product [Oncorhynchus mykiss]
MEQRGCGAWLEGRQWVVLLVALIFFWSGASAQIKYSISEELKEGTVVGNIAKDLGIDLSTLTERGFRIVSGSTEPLFQVNRHDGILYVNRKIDREEVYVLDVNDNTPLFTKDVYSVMLNENSPLGTTVIQVNATDLDDGVNGHVIYLFGNDVNSNIQKIFDLDAKTGQITDNIYSVVTKSQLDREKQAHYDVIILAKDSGQPFLSSVTTISVVVSDVNDNSPEFSLSPYTFYVLENNDPGGSHLQDVNYDGTLCHSIQYRSGDNRYMFRIVSGSKEGFLQINQDNGDKIPFLILKKPLDREQKLEMMLVLTAFDGGKPVRSGTVNITITVIDVNDNAPVFERQVYTVTLDENTPLGESLFSLSTSDRDQDDNARVSYHIWKGDGDTPIVSYLNINSDGNIYALKSFDFEATKTFKFQVVATDSGTPLLSSNVTVNVFILDQNDNAPVILYPVSANGSAEGVEEIPRNVNAGHLVTKVRAYDADIGYNGWLLFSLQEVTDHSLFALDRYTGQIRTLRSFTETDEADHKLVILVKDNGNVSLSATATVIIKVLDVNDHSPSFPEKEKRLEMSESALQGTRFQLHAADDPDSGQYSVQQYKLSQNDHFRLEVKDRGDDRKTPILVLQKTLDREALKSHKLILTALDGGKPPRSGEIRITVDVSDVNDNAPVFTKELYSVLLNENAPLGTTVIQVNATDLDEGSNGEVTYYFANDVQGKVRKRFDLDPKTGEIIVTGVIDYEENKIYEIDIQASDKGTAALTTEKSVIIKIVDVNDNAPEIEVTSFANAIPENSRPGTTVALINVNDLDSGLNGKVLSSIITDHSLFALDRYTGQIRTLRSFTETDEAEHKLVILVKDNGNVSLSATATVIINVVEPKEAFAASDVKSSVKYEEENSVTFYLTITLGSVSTLFLISIIVLIVMQCSKPTDYSSKYLQDVNNDGTLCHSIQYRSGDKRYMLVGPRMSIGSTIVPGSNGNTLVIPEHRRRASGEVRS